MKNINKKIIIGKMVVFGILLLFTTAIMTTEMNTKAADDIEWEVKLEFNEPDGAYDWVTLGEASDATDGPPVDSYDEPKPPAPPMPPYVRAWFNDNLTEPYDLLLKDYREHPDSHKVWNLTILWLPSDYNSTTINISWNISEVDDSEYISVILYDPEGNPLKDMITQKNYSFTCPANEAQQFQIICQGETSNGKTDTIETLLLILILALIIIVIIALVYWKTKR